MQNFLQSPFTEFNYFTATLAVEMVMMRVMGCLKMSMVLAEIILLYHPCLLEEIERTVDSGKTDAVILFLCLQEDEAGIGMTGGFIQYVQNELPLTGQIESFPGEI